MNYNLLPLDMPDSLPGRLAGIDAGGSATRIIVLADGKLNALPPAPPLNAVQTPDVGARLWGLIGDLITAAAPSAVGIGLPGVRTAGTAASLSSRLTERAGIPVHVTDDGATAVLGAFRGQPGIVVHAGTGSGARGWNGTQWAQAGGRGYLLGDEGSAYWLGRAAVSAALRYLDGTGGSPTLASAVEGAAGCPLPDLVRKIYNHPSERIILTPFAPVVTSLAGDGDPAALAIVDSAAEELAALASALRSRLGSDLPVCGMGGVLSTPVLWGRFAALTGAVRPLAPPEVGAALLAGGVASVDDVSGDPASGDHASGNGASGDSPSASASGETHE